jgi:uncharacterized membrane-anchored protein
MSIATLKKVIEDCSTGANGDYDPARVIGYGVTLLGSLVFLGLTIYVTIITKAFNSEGFAIGLAGISAVITAAAGGVLMKKSTEIPLDVNTTVTSTATPDTKETVVATTTTESASK